MHAAVAACCCTLPLASPAVPVACRARSYRLFAEPPLPDEEGGIEALAALSCPMDLLTMLYKARSSGHSSAAATLHAVQQPCALPQQAMFLQLPLNAAPRVQGSQPCAQQA